MDDKHGSLTGDRKILAPLLIFIAAYSGIHSRDQTPALQHNALDEHTLQYCGKSHVKYINHGPLWKRFICAMGGMTRGDKIYYTVLVFTLSKYLILDTIDTMFGTDESIWPLPIPLVAALLTFLLFMITAPYARRQRAKATPPEFDPSSYQYRLMAALRASGVTYGDVTRSLEELDRQIRKHTGPRLKEQFVIHDLEERGKQCDVLVRFFGNGQVILTAAGEEAKPELLISHV